MIDRREFLKGSTAAVTTMIAGVATPSASAEPPPETTTIRLPRFSFDVACLAPLWVAEELLRAEGFNDVQYVPNIDSGADIAAGKLDFAMYDVFGVLLDLDAGAPLVMLAGIHGGCYELFATERVRSIRDLKGKTVGVTNRGRQAFVATMAAYVGLDPRRDVTFVHHHGAEAIRLLGESKIDAFLGFPPEPQELRARKIGHSIVNTALDRPWSQYLCCMAVSSQEFIRKHPVATKRALRAFVKATDICALDPERVARFVVDRGYVKNYPYAAEALKDVPYRRWREYDAADTIRFYALRLHGAGLIKSTPQTILAQGTDWRFLTELKKELKG